MNDCEIKVLYGKEAEAVFGKRELDDIVINIPQEVADETIDNDATEACETFVQQYEVLTGNQPTPAVLAAYRLGYGDGKKIIIDEAYEAGISEDSQFAKKYSIHMGIG